jgi:hypothetical protein
MERSEYLANLALATQTQYTLHPYVAPRASYGPIVKFALALWRWL